VDDYLQVDSEARPSLGSKCVDPAALEGCYYSKVREDARSFAETEVAAPAPHIRDQFRHRRIDADALCTSCDLPDSPLKTVQALWRDCALDLGSVCKGESKELPLLWSRHRTLGLVHFEFELLGDEFRDLFITR
jgi:hypothetical protein